MALFGVFVNSFLQRFPSREGIFSLTEKYLYKKNSAAGEERPPG
jgi:hypothetical protein